MNSTVLAYANRLVQGCLFFWPFVLFVLFVLFRSFALCLAWLIMRSKVFLHL